MSEHEVSHPERDLDTPEAQAGYREEDYAFLSRLTPTELTALGAAMDEYKDYICGTLHPSSTIRTTAEVLQAWLEPQEIELDPAMAGWLSQHDSYREHLIAVVAQMVADTRSDVRGGSTMTNQEAEAYAVELADRLHS